MANKDYTIRQLLQMEACTNCQACAEVCPAVVASSQAELSAVQRMKEQFRDLIDDWNRRHPEDMEARNFYNRFRNL